MPFRPASVEGDEKPQHANFSTIFKFKRQNHAKFFGGVEGMIYLCVE